MIDLRNKDLPNAIQADGKSFLIQTDFRFWLNFGANLDKDNPEKIIAVIPDLFIDDLPEPSEEVINKLLEFYACKDVTPKEINNGRDEKLLDMIQDGSYIYASFMQCYGIDLIDIEYLHWHKFITLFKCLSEDCIIKKIISYRGYVKSEKSEESIRRELREMWSLPYEGQQDDSMLQELNELFYNS